MLKPNNKFSQFSNKGFTLIETVVGILVITTFTLVALEAIVLATVFKVKARLANEVTSWIQQDLEYVKYQASQYVDASQCATGYAAGFSTSIGSSPVTSSKTILGKVYTLSRTPIINASYPHVLQLEYAVTPAPWISSAPNFFTEVVPNAALQCS